MTGVDPFNLDYTHAAGHVVVMRMSDKRQVFTRLVRPVDADSRLSHTVSVVRIASAVAKALCLNESLAATIALCHDVAHCPYGHLGEKVLSEYLLSIGVPEYDHVNAAPYVLSNIGNLDLSFEVLEGITWHSLSSGVLSASVPNEYRLVALSDKIAYVLGDAWDTANMFGSGSYGDHSTVKPEDAAGLQSELRHLRESLGQTDRERFERLIEAIVTESSSIGEIGFATTPEAKAFEELKAFLARKIYTQTDLTQDINRLHRVAERLVASDITGNPYMLFALLTDSELYFLDEVEGPIKQDVIDLLQVGDLTLPGRDDFSFLAPDLSWVYS